MALNQDTWGVGAAKASNSEFRAFGLGFGRGIFCASPMLFASGSCCQGRFSYPCPCSITSAPPTCHRASRAADSVANSARKEGSTQSH